VGPRASLDVVVKRKFPSPRRESNPRTPIVQSVAQPLYVRNFSKDDRYNSVIVRMYGILFGLFHLDPFAPVVYM
jgi:hypothetical protein